jgi:hypothetical protein
MPCSAIAPCPYGRHDTCTIASSTVTTSSREHRGRRLGAETVPLIEISLITEFEGSQWAMYPALMHVNR